MLAELTKTVKDGILSGRLTEPEGDPMPQTPQSFPNPLRPVPIKRNIVISWEEKGFSPLNCTFLSGVTVSEIMDGAIFRFIALPDPLPHESKKRLTRDKGLTEGVTLIVHEAWIREWSAHIEEKMHDSAEKAASLKERLKVTPDDAKAELEASLAAAEAEYEKFKEMPGALVVMVYRFGALEAKRAMERVSLKNELIDFPEYHTAMKLVNEIGRMILEMDPRNGVDVANYQAKVDEFMELMTSSLEESAKARMSEQGLRMRSVKDILGRVNKERLELMLVPIRFFLEELHRHLRRRQIVDTEHVAALEYMLNAITVEAGLNEIVAKQARGSGRLLYDMSEVDNKDNAVRFWRSCASRCRKLYVEPFSGLFRTAANNFSLAADELEKLDFNPEAVRLYLERAEIMCRLVRVLVDLNNIITPVAEARSLSLELPLKERVRLNEEIWSVMAEIKGIPSRFPTYENDLSRHFYEEEIMDAETGLQLASQHLNRDEFSTENLEQAYVRLRQASHALSIG